MTIQFKDTDIYYSSRGKGNPVVLLHGFLESTTIWQKTTAEICHSRQVISIDLPGHGKSGCIAQVHTMEELAAAVYAVLNHLKIEKADFIGHSMGGYVALALLDRHPEIFRKIVLLNSTPAADSEERKENRDRAVEVVSRNKKAFVSMAISNLLSTENNRKFRKEITLLKKEAQSFPTKGIIAALTGMKIRTNRKRVLQQFRGEKFILAGKADPILDYHKTREIAEECNCHLTSFPDGHLSYLENEQEFIQWMHFIE